MGFQSTVSVKSAAGVPGEFYDSSPYRALSYVIDSASAAYNIIGATMFTVTSEGIAEAGSGGIDFAGLLVNPKAYALEGTSAGGTLAPTLTLANDTQAELATEGRFWVTLPASATIGDLVIYDNTTGAIATIANDAALPSGKSFGYAKVIQFTPTAAGLAVIEMSPTFTIPQPA